MRHWTLAYRDADRERVFMAQYGREVRVYYGIAMLGALALWCASVGLDLVASADARAPFYVIRFGVVAPILAVATVIGFAPEKLFARAWHVASTTVFGALLGGTIALTATATHETFPYTVGGFLLAILISAGADVVRAIYILIVGVLGAATMAVALALSPHTTPRDLAVDILWVVVALIGAVLVSGRSELARRQRFDQDELLERERARSEALLENLLPKPIAARLKDGPKVIADGLPDVTVLFADMKGFTVLATQLAPEELVDRLDKLFSAFDALALTHGLEKIKTIGDAYMAVAGAPFARDDHALAATRMALAMIQRLAELEPTLALRIGLASGPVVAGVIGRTKQSYDIWGETVNLASRMESHGVAGRVQIAAPTRALLGDAIAVEDRGAIDLKGLGPTPAFLVVA